MLTDEKGGHPHCLHPTWCWGRRLTILVVVDEVDDATESAIEYARMLGPERLFGIHLRRSRPEAQRVRREWEPSHPDIALVEVDVVGGSPIRTLSALVNSELPAREHPVIVMVPHPEHGPSVMPRERQMHDLANAFLGADDVFVVEVSSSYEPE